MVLDKIGYRVAVYAGTPKKFCGFTQSLQNINTTDKRKKLYHIVDKYAGDGIYENDLVDVKGYAGRVEYSIPHKAFFAWVDCEGVKVPYYMKGVKKICCGHGINVTNEPRARWRLKSGITDRTKSY